MVGREPAEAQAGDELIKGQCPGADPGREQGRAVVVEGEQALVEQGVQVHGEKQAVVGVEPFLVGFAAGPGLGVAGRRSSGMAKPVTAQAPPQ